MVFNNEEHEKFYYEKLEQRLTFNLYPDGTPSVDDYKRKDEQIREYSVSDIFCCGYAMY